MRRGYVWALAAGLLVATAAVALEKGTTLYVRSRNTRLLDKPGGKVLAVLQPGEKVRWQGPLAGAAGWHQVSYKNRKGALLTANLATKPPAMEIVSTKGKKAMDTSTFLSSGAATKALGPGAIAYGEKRSMKQAVQDVEAMERISKAVTPQQIAAHARAAGLAEAVGPTTVASEGVR